jgi:hypothetical protein
LSEFLVVLKVTQGFVVSHDARYLVGRPVALTVHDDALPQARLDVLASEEIWIADAEPEHRKHVWWQAEFLGDGLRAMRSAPI